MFFERCHIKFIWRRFSFLIFYFKIISMIILAHVAFASAVSKSLRLSWPMAFLFGLVSHHVIDLIPHVDAACVWTRKQRDAGIMPVAAKVFIAVDALATLVFFIWCWLFLKTNLPVLFWASFGAVLPDLIITGFTTFYHPALKWSFMKKYERFHWSIFTHMGIPENFVFGILTTALVIGFSFLLLRI